MTNYEMMEDLNELLIENGLDEEFSLKIEGNGIVVLHDGYKALVIDDEPRQRMIIVKQYLNSGSTVSGKAYFYSGQPFEVYDEIIESIGKLQGSREREVTVHNEPKNANGIHVKRGDVFKGKNSDLINLLFDKNYRGWMKSGYTCRYKGEIACIWMPRLDGYVRDGWEDTMPSNDRIKEKYVDGIPKVRDSLEYVKIHSAYRYVFQKVDRDTKFIFKGLYKLNPADSNVNTRYFDLISDTADF